MPLGVGQAHQHHASNARLQVLLGEPGEVQTRLEGVEHRADRHLAQGQTGSFRQIVCVLHRVGRGIATRHRDPEHSIGAQSIDRECTDERRVDSATEAEQDARETVLVHIVGQSQAQRGVQLSGIIESRGVRGSQRRTLACRCA